MITHDDGSPVIARLRVMSTPSDMTTPPSRPRRRRGPDAGRKRGLDTRKPGPDADRRRGLDTRRRGPIAAGGWPTRGIL